MEIKTFKIRLRFCSDWKNNKYTYIDELPSDSGLSDLRAEYSWIAVGNYRDIQYYNRVNYGYNDNDVMMECNYENGMLNVTLVANESFDKLVTCIEDNKLITRTLFDWVKIHIAGQVSDGIGENEVAVYRNGSGDVFDVWLGEFITDEPTSEWGFAIPEPIKVEENQAKIESMYIPNFLEQYNKLLEENEKSNSIESYHKMEEMRNMNIKHLANELDKYNL